MEINKRHLLNYSILIPYLILSIIGLIIVYSTTSASLIQYGLNPFKSVISQALFWIISLLGIVFIYKLKLDFLKNSKVLLLAIFVEFILLIIARFFTKEVNGAHGWIILGPISFQPAEYLKLLVVWYLSFVFSRKQKQIEIYDYRALSFQESKQKGILNIDSWWFYSGLMIFIVAMQPDLGNATIIVLTAIIVYLISGVSYRWFSSIILAIPIFSAFFLGGIKMAGVEKVKQIPVFGYVAKRFSAFYNPFLDVTDSGHQLVNSYYAMSNGGWFGLGLGNSIEKRGYLPEATTDFVFSIVIEELGLIGAGFILALLFFLILRIMYVGIKAKNPFNAMIALGVGAMLLTQVFVNIGGISGLIPSTGVTFPFLSQGGNSVLVLSIAVAFVLNIDANEKRESILSEADRQLHEGIKEDIKNNKVIKFSDFN